MAGFCYALPPETRRQEILRLIIVISRSSVGRLVLAEYRPPGVSLEAGRERGASGVALEQAYMWMFRRRPGIAPPSQPQTGQSTMVLLKLGSRSSLEKADPGVRARPTVGHTRGISTLALARPIARTHADNGMMGRSDQRTSQK
jgi:hypothetical protein